MKWHFIKKNEIEQNQYEIKNKTMNDIEQYRTNEKGMNVFFLFGYNNEMIYFMFDPL